MPDKTPKRLIVPIHILAKREKPEESEEPQITQLQLIECVALINEISLLRANLSERRASLRRCLECGMEVEDGPLKSFAARIARGYFLRDGHHIIRSAPIAIPGAKPLARRIRQRAVLGHSK